MKWIVVILGVVAIGWVAVAIVVISEDALQETRTELKAAEAIENRLTCELLEVKIENCDLHLELEGMKAGHPPPSIPHDMGELIPAGREAK